MVIEDRLVPVLRIFKVLADESQLRIVGILATRVCSVEELASLLGLRPPTVSHHLARLKEVGLVTMQPDGNTHLYRLDAEALRAISKDLLSPTSMPAYTPDLAEDPWESKILRDFFDGERLKSIPASRKKRSVILHWLAGRFELGTRYPERDVNAIIERHHDDFATLRRELIGAKLMARENGVYWRLPNPIPAAGAAEPITS